MYLLPAQAREEHAGVFAATALSKQLESLLSIVVEFVPSRRRRDEYMFVG